MKLQDKKCQDFNHQINKVFGHTLNAFSEEDTTNCFWMGCFDSTLMYPDKKQWTLNESDNNLE